MLFPVEFQLIDRGVIPQDLTGNVLGIPGGFQMLHDIWILDGPFVVPAEKSSSVEFHKFPFPLLFDEKSLHCRN